MEYSVQEGQLYEENQPEQPELTEEERVIAQANEEMVLFGAPLGAYAVNSVGHAAIRNVVLPVVYDLTAQLEITKEALEKSEAESHQENSELHREIEELNSQIAALKSSHFEEVSKLKTDLYQAEQLAADNAKKRDNASNELIEAKNTIDELNAKLSAATAPKIPVRTNVEGVAEYVKPKKRAIYDVQYIGQFKNKYKAKFADTDEEFEDFSVYKDAKYEEVTAEEAPSFRIEKPVPEDDQRSSSVEEQPVIVPSVDTFREEDEETAGSDVVTESSSVVGQFITEERILSIENDLAKIKGMLRI